MKSTVRQKEICDIIIGQAKAWKDTNDINSPSHYTYIIEEIRKTNLNDDQQNVFIRKLAGLFSSIKDLIE